MGEKNEALKSPSDTTGNLTRRNFLVGLSELAILASLSRASLDRPSGALPLVEESTPIAPADRLPEEDHAFEGADKEYLAQLLGNLKEKTGNRTSRLKAIRHSLRWVEMQNDPNSSPQPVGTALQLDDSGIYLTAGHVAKYSTNPELNQVHLAMTNLYNGEAHRVKAVIRHRSADIAIVYAPTGNPPQPTHDLQVGTQKMEDGERLWLCGFYPDVTNHMYLTLRNGTVDTSLRPPGIVPEKINEVTFFSEPLSRVAVRGLIPGGGMSGSPIVDERCRIVGVESGVFPATKSVADYRGAVITPLTYADFANQPIFVY